MRFEYDVIVVGAGHAGCEAAVAAAKLGASTLLITADMNRVAQMSCNPAVGGIAKGQIVREIDALGGMTGIIADKTAIQFRMLNRSKGPAVWSPRVQSDRTRFIDEWRRALDETDNLYLFQDMVTRIVIETSDSCDSGPRYEARGVETALGVVFKARKVIVTSGTFLNGLMHFGKTQIAGGRISESAAVGLSDQLGALGIRVGRMKTGTPARIDGASVDYSETVVQSGDDKVSDNGEVARDFHKFSFLPEIRENSPSRLLHSSYQSGGA